MEFLSYFCTKQLSLDPDSTKATGYVNFSGTGGLWWFFCFSHRIRVTQILNNLRG